VPTDQTTIKQNRYLQQTVITEYKHTAKQTGPLSIKQRSNKFTFQAVGWAKQSVPIMSVSSQGIDGHGLSAFGVSAYLPILPYLQSSGLGCGC
jgi:hypothetical protein